MVVGGKGTLPTVVVDVIVAVVVIFTQQGIDGCGFSSSS